MERINIKDDKVYMKKDFLGWRQVYPLKNDDGSWNYPNLLFGGYRNLIFLVLVLSCVFLVIFAYKTDTQECFDFINNVTKQTTYACEVCSKGSGSLLGYPYIDEEVINLTIFNEPVP